MNVALVLSGGVGTRLGTEIPKQYIEVGGRTIISYCLETLSKSTDIDAIQIVADEGWHDSVLKSVERYDAAKKYRGFSKPGFNRQLSIWNGLNSIREYASDEDMVLIHDGARPMLTSELIAACFRATVGHDGALPVLPMKDTVYYSADNKKITSLLERSCVYAGQAPEVFVLGAYYKANQVLLPDEILKINGSTEPAIMAGMDIAMFPGDENNFKVTTKADLLKLYSMFDRT